MNGTQARKTLAFAKHEDDKCARSWWSLTVYNWCRPHRSLQQLLDEPVGRQKYEHRSPAMTIGLANYIFSQAEIFLTPAILSPVGDNLILQPHHKYSHFSPFPTIYGGEVRL